MNPTQIILPALSTEKMRLSCCKYLSVICLCFLLGRPLYAQEKPVEKSLPIDRTCYLTTENATPVYKQIANSIALLKREGRLILPRLAVAARNAGNYAVMFDWPLRYTGNSEFPYWYINNYVDLNVNEGEYNILDYYDGNKTYDGHNGCDIVPIPYYWQMKEGGEVSVVAAASGTLILKSPGTGPYQDNNCSFDNWQSDSTETAYGNYIALLHADGSTVTFYGHMKAGSVTNKPIGSLISSGEYLGKVGSSGRSTAPHLHFEVHRNANFPANTGTLVEPFSDNEALSQWIDQKPYKDSAIIGIELHNASPDYYNNTCDSSVNLNTISQNFTSLSDVYLRIFYRELGLNLGIKVGLFKPDNSIAQSYSDFYSNSRFASDWWYYHLPLNPEQGVWHYSLSYAGKSFNKFFTVGGCSVNDIIVTPHSGTKAYINSGYISSIATISGSTNNWVEYHADNYVQLNIGFTATAGCYFKADTKGCNTSN